MFGTALGRRTALACLFWIVTRLSLSRLAQFIHRTRVVAFLEPSWVSNSLQRLGSRTRSLSI